MESQVAPDFQLPASGGRQVGLGDFRGRGVILYFYPRDNTPGCTTEGQDFRDLYSQFTAAGWEVLGISRDSVKCHDHFKTRLGLPFDLLADIDAQVCERYGVMKMKKLYGKQVHGIERSTFAITPQGFIARAWRGVKVPNHARDVLEFVRSLA